MRALVAGAVILLAVGLTGCGDEPPAPAVAPAVAHDPAWPDAGRYQALGNPAQPAVGVAVVRAAAGARLYLRVARLPGAAPRLDLGIGAGTPRHLTRADATMTDTDADNEYLAFDLAGIGTDWAAFRLALALAWADGANGADRRRERYGFADHRATHAPFNPEPASWQLFDLAAHDRRWAERADRLVVRVRQPLDGKLSVVIEDLAGKRVRNLAGGVAAMTGWHEYEWDGLDEAGNLAAPGEYRWRSIHHPGIRPDYRFSFANGREEFLSPWGTNHGTWVAATHNDQYVFVAAPLTEGGWALVCLSDAGAFVRGYQQPHGTPYDGVAVAATDKYLYAVHDGRRNRGRLDRSDPKWVADCHVTLSRYDIAEGKAVAWDREAFLTVAEYQYGPGVDNPALQSRCSLAGAARLGDRLYVALRHLPGILVLDLETGEEVGRLAVADPGPLAAAGDRLWVVTGDRLRALSPAGEELTNLALPAGMQPAGIAAGPAGRLYLSDLADHTVRCLDPAGKIVGTYGHAGGPYAGPYDPARLVSPAGLTVARDRLWVMPRSRQPKRVVAFDLASGAVAVDKVGSPPYGAPGGGIDPTTPGRWVALGCLWAVDPEARTARITHVLTPNGGHLDGRCRFLQNYVFTRAGGHEYLVGAGKFTLVSELLPDGSLVDRAMVGNPHMLAYGCGWDPPPAIVEAIQADYPWLNAGNHFRDYRKGPDGLAIFWVDRNGNGQVDREEVEIVDVGRRFHMGYWGLMQRDLDLRISYIGDTPGTRLLTLAPDGVDANGVPRYPRLADALGSAAVALDPPIDVDGEIAVDRQGRIAMVGDPDMVGIDADGTVRWRYPNGWRNVHGSHKAPLPEVGVVQGVLQVLGVAPLDDVGDVFVLNGNHGRFFLLTSDGMYLDEMFRDTRMGGPNDSFHVGGEPFGGVFARDEASGAYYLQTGGSGYRVYRLRGLDAVQRQSGELTVTPAQLLAAEAGLRRRRAAEQEPRLATIPHLEPPTRVDGRADDWTVPPAVTWTRDGRFPVTLRLGWDADTLYLYYDVRDASPWCNGGNDWTNLFKTGDSVDLQIGADPAAKPDRREPIAGDVRVLIAPFGKENIAVLYHHRAADATAPVVFSSPWRSETVNVVRRLENVRIGVEVGDGWYRVEAAIPLADLGLKMSPEPRRADFGVLYGDPAGEHTGLRSYWANPSTALVSDVPGEIMLHPNLWGTVRFTNGSDQEETE